MDKDEANILRDLLPDLQLVNGIISKHQKYHEENAERREKIPRRRKRRKKHHKIPSSSFIKTKTISMNNLEPKDIMYRSTTTPESSNKLYDDSDNDNGGELKLHEIDFNKLLQKLESNEEENGGDRTYDHKKTKHLRNHRKKKSKKRHHKKSAFIQQQQNIQNTNDMMVETSSQKEDVTLDTSNKQSPGELYTKLFHKIEPKLSMKRLTISPDTKQNNLPIQSMGRGVKPTPHAPLRKKIIPDKEQFLVMFQKNTPTSVVDTKHVFLEGNKKNHHHEVIVVNDIKAFHRLESISPAVKATYDIERPHHVEDDGYQKRASVKVIHKI